MAAVVTLYDHTIARQVAGLSPATNTFKVNLYTVLPLVAGATTKAEAEAGATQLPTANGYTQDAKALTGVVVPTIATNDAKFSFDTVQWDPTGAGIAGSFALVFDDTPADDPPIAHIDFGGEVTAEAGVPFQIIPPAGGFVTYTYTP